MLSNLTLIDQHNNHIVELGEDDKRSSFAVKTVDIDEQQVIVGVKCQEKPGYYGLYGLEFKLA